MSIEEEGAAIARAQQAADQLKDMITTIVNALDDCERTLGEGFYARVGATDSYVIPRVRLTGVRDLTDVAATVANARAALRVAGRRP